MRPISLVYVGAGMSGRSSSLAHVLEACGVSTDALTLDPAQAHEFQLHRKVSARISAMRSWLMSRATADTALDPRVRAELEWLRHADGFIFVLDSQPARQPANKEQLDLLRADLDAHGLNLDEMPVVFQANKRDLHGIVSMETLRREFRTGRCAHAESVASQGIGVLNAVRLLVSLIEA